MTAGAATKPAAVRRVSVVIPHYNDLAALDRCLTGLSQQTYPVHEIIVADNNSPVGLEAVAGAVRDRATIVTVMEKGAGPARNGGVALARGEILAFIDSDCIPDPEWLAEGVRALASGDFVGGRVRVKVEREDAPRPVEAFEAVFAFDNERYVKQLGFTVTANLFCPKALFEQVGGFRVGLSEDLDWSHRARAAGGRLVYAESAVVAHPARASWEELIRKWKRLNAETFALHAGRRGHKLRWILRSCLLPASALAHTPKVLTSPALSSWRQRRDALSVLYRLRFWRLIDAIGLLTRGR